MDVYPTQIDRGSDRFQRNRAEMLACLAEIDAPLARALQKAGFRVARQGKHIVMTDGVRIITIPRHSRVNALTMGGIFRDAGLREDEFRALL